MMKNNLLKYETHLHTSESSACGVSSGAEMADYYKDSGYSGFVVTDHFFNGNTSIKHDLPWDERVSLFCKGYENAKKRGDKIGFDVFFGFEYNFRGTEFLIYGLDKEWLINHPEIMQDNLKEVLKLIRDSGGMIIHAHPFREDWYIDMIRLIPSLTDVVEVYNAGNFGRNPVANERALTYAQMYGIPCITGTDIHSRTIEIYGGIAVTSRLGSIYEIMDVIKSQECSLLWRDEIIDIPVLHELHK